jgi:photosystem II stability/assembly factor-like uncharacterized protein
MKTIFFFLTILFFLAPEIKAQQKSNSTYDPSCGLWTIENSSAQNHNNFSDNLFNWQYVVAQAPEDFLDVFFIDSLYGWACHTNNGGVRTTNSGFDWESFSFLDTNFSTLYNGVFFLNRDTGWCVGGAVEIRKTTNGGVNWFRQISPPVAGIAHSVYFFNANTGIIIGSKNFPYEPFVAKTTNSGNNWTEIFASGSGHELNGQFWFNENTGWICAYDNLLYTTTGGANFMNMYSNLPPTGNGHNALLSIYFVNQQTGWIGAANLERNNIYKTTNGGTNWFFQDNPVSQAGWNQINDIRFISPDSGWAAHGTPGTGAIMFTSNGGANWVMDNTQYSWYDCLEAYSRSKVWSGGSEGRIWYTLIEEATGINATENNVPDKFTLFQNYPNPFNPETVIRYSLIKNGFVMLKIFNILGNEVATLVDEKQNAGSHSVKFNAAGFSSGIYYYKLEAGNFTDVRKMILLK